MVELAVAKNAVSASELRKFRSSVGKVLSATSRQKLLVLGDSTQTGRGAGTGGTGEIAARRKSPSQFLTTLLNSRGIPARGDAFFGNAGILTGSAADYASYNTNVAFGAGWSNALANPVYLGGAWWGNSTNTNALTFTPERAADRFDIYYIAAGGSGNGTFTVTDSGGTLATINTNTGTYACYKQTVTRAAASVLPISIQRNGTGAAIYIGAIDPWNSTLPELCVLNAAQSGIKASFVTDVSDPTTSKAMIDLIAAELHYVEFGLNEKAGGDSVAAASSNLTTLATNCQALGALAVGISAPATSGNSYDLTSDWRAAIAAVASAKSAPLVDHYARMVSREAATGDYIDAVHLLGSGYAIKGAAMFDLLAA